MGQRKKTLLPQVYAGGKVILHEKLKRNRSAAFALMLLRLRTPGFDEAGAVGDAKIALFPAAQVMPDGCGAPR
jgi:hypothetical protein